MHDIDFLPAEYRQKYARRMSYGRRLVAATLVVATMVAAAWSQRYRRRQVEAELARCEPARAAAVQTQDALSELQGRLQLARASAELFTYLRHPWPRTRVLAGLLGPLPDEIAFEQLRIEREALSGAQAARGLSWARSEGDEGPSAGLAPATRDLTRLREEFDSRQIVVTIVGLTTESAALHQYVGELGREPLFSKAQLHSIEADKSDPTRIRFSVTVMVRPGYGQPDGPSGRNPNLAVVIDQKTT